MEKDKVSEFIRTMVETNLLFEYNMNVAHAMKVEEFQPLFITHHKSFLPPTLYIGKDEEYIDCLSRPFYWHYRINLGLRESKREYNNYTPKKAVNYSRRPDLHLVRF